MMGKSSFFAGVKNNYSRIILVLSLVAFTASCTRKSDDGNLAVFHGFEKDDVKTWDPANAYDSVSLDLVPSIYETLYQYKYLSEEFQTEPLLAEKEPVYSKDKLTVTIPIKKGIFYQDDPCFKATNGKGRELKAQDFVYGMKRLALPSLQSQGWWIFDNKLVGINAFHDKLAAASKEGLQKAFEEPIEGLKALDDYTLQLKLTKPYPDLPFILAMSFTAPVPHEAVEKYGDSQGNLLENPVGTGPFKLTRWVRSHEIILERNSNYRKEAYPAKGSPIFQKQGLLADAGKSLPFVERLVFEVVKEDQPRWLNFMKGNADVIVLPKDNFRQAINEKGALNADLVTKGMHLSVDTGVIIRYVSINMKDKTLGGNKYLRQALSAALDRDKWISIFTNGTGKKMVNAIPPGIPDRPRADKIKYDFNLARAKELLKKAGYPEGKGLPPLRFDLRGASSTDRQLGEFFQEQFAQIGVTLEVIPNTFPAFLEKLKQGALQISYGAWQMDYPDAENVLQLLYGPNQSPGPADSNYDNPEMNKLYEKMAILDSGKVRADLVQKMDDILQEDCPWLLGYYEATYILSQPWLSNYRGTELIANKYKYFKVDKDLKKKSLQSQ